MNLITNTPSFGYKIVVTPSSKFELSLNNAPGYKELYKLVLEKAENLEKISKIKLKRRHILFFFRGLRYIQMKET
jgi:hypothetical protein